MYAPRSRRTVMRTPHLPSAPHARDARIALAGRGYEVSSLLAGGRASAGRTYPGGTCMVIHPAGGLGPRRAGPRWAATARAALSPRVMSAQLAQPWSAVCHTVEGS